MTDAPRHRRSLRGMLRIAWLLAALSMIVAGYMLMSAAPDMAPVDAQRRVFAGLGMVLAGGVAVIVVRWRR